MSMTVSVCLNRMNEVQLGNLLYGKPIDRKLVCTIFFIVVIDF